MDEHHNVQPCIKFIQYDAPIENEHQKTRNDQIE